MAVHLGELHHFLATHCLCAKSSSLHVDTSLNLQGPHLWDDKHDSESCLLDLWCCIARLLDLALWIALNRRPSIIRDTDRAALSYGIRCVVPVMKLSRSTCKKREDTIVSVGRKRDLLTISEDKIAQLYVVFASYLCAAAKCTHTCVTTCTASPALVDVSGAQAMCTPVLFPFPQETYPPSHTAISHEAFQTFKSVPGRPK
jgi:hypothetical protein